MKKVVFKTENERLVEQYFKLIADLRGGSEEAIDDLADFWDEKGIFNFAGSPPVVGTFAGKMAITVLYRNRFYANGMNLTLGNAESLRSATLGIVATELTHIRDTEEAVIAGWNTTIGTTEGEGFDVSGSHFFVIQNGKIKELRVNISSKYERSSDSFLNPDNLTVQDVGRLSLAAWPVV